MTDENKKEKYRKAYKKSSRAEYEVRVMHIYDLLMRGYTYSDICLDMSERFDVTSRQVSRYIERVKIRLNTESQSLKSKTKSVILSRYEYIYKKAIEKEDLYTAIKTLNNISEMEGIKINKTEVTGTINIIEVDKQDKGLV